MAKKAAAEDEVIRFLLTCIKSLGDEVRVSHNTAWPRLYTQLTKYSSQTGSLLAKSSKFPLEQRIFSLPAYLVRALQVLTPRV